jgi:hypothetical protein
MKHLPYFVAAIPFPPIHQKALPRNLPWKIVTSLLELG